ncbi:unnamed protein product [Cuscuta epithymum]|uniref:Secreted protein n=1 Tax=Cuscuta epithymum TaxID=186058 RepID=A0AAV0ETF8_9ASTE|nr:unnamed protein product [Cuscuta epithymum]
MYVESHLFTLSVIRAFLKKWLFRIIRIRIFLFAFFTCSVHFSWRTNRAIFHCYMFFSAFAGEMIRGRSTRNVISGDDTREIYQKCDKDREARRGAGDSQFNI